MIVPLLAVLLVLAVVAVAAWILRQRVVAEGAKEQHLLDPASTTLVYAVPPGQAPAVLVAALEGRGYAAAADVTEGPQLLRVAAPGRALDRDAVRTVIAGAGSTSVEGGGDPVQGARVRFEDEA